jgi:hypothetical protein
MQPWSMNPQPAEAAVTALERVTAVLERARVAGGWMDEDVARAVLAVLYIDEDGGAVAVGPEPEAGETAE